ncbi:hypothetical protein [Sulfitobacter sp.]|uniref:TadE/TadG family type IV pilus assembly protein n=1 Tax=Sulfitobacter sp. TaxID=1903071 RepID=UPI0032976240
MSVRNKLTAIKRKFSRDEEGGLAIEAIIMLPLMFFVVMSMFTLFDAFRQYTMHQKAAYTLSDMISRETVPLDSSYLTGAHALFDDMTRNPQESSIRVSVVRYDENNDIFKLDWSQTQGYSTPLSNQDVRNWGDRLPVLVHNERILVVETFANYAPPFETGLGSREIENFIFTRPRYSPQILWDDDEGSFADS